MATVETDIIFKDLQANWTGFFAKSRVLVPWDIWLTVKKAFYVLNERLEVAEDRLWVNETEKNEAKEVNGYEFDKEVNESLRVEKARLHVIHF